MLAPELATGDAVMYHGPSGQSVEGTVAELDTSHWWVRQQAAHSGRRPGPGLSACCCSGLLPLRAIRMLPANCWIISYARVPGPRCSSCLLQAT